MMKKFIPYEKLSPKEQRKLDKRQRGDWGAVKPVSVPFETDKRRRRRNKHRNRDLDE